MKKIICLFLVVLITVTFVGCGVGNNQETQSESAKEETVKREPMNVSVGCGTSSGVGYATASTVGALLQSNYPTYSVKPEITTGGAESIRLLVAGDVTLCSAMSDDVLAAYNGERGFEGTKGRLRYITSGNITTIQCFAQKDLDVEELDDCKGLNVAVQSGTMYTYYWNYLLEAYGLTSDDFKSVKSMATKDAVNAFQDGTIDLFCMVTAVPNATIQDLAMSTGVRVLTMSEDKRDAAIKLQPCYRKTEVKGELYNSDGIAKTIGVRNVYVCLDSTNYQLVYDWVKTIDENNDALRAAHPQAGEYGLHENVLANQIIPFHDAALKYYTEIGLVKN